MYQRNEGIEASDVLQNAFTAYFIRSILNMKANKYHKRERKEQHEIITDMDAQFADKYSGADLFEQSQYIQSQIEDEMLLQAVTQLSERDRAILFGHVVEERGYDGLAEELGIGYKGVAAAYYRTVHKLKEKLRP